MIRATARALARPIVPLALVLSAGVFTGCGDDGGGSSAELDCNAAGGEANLARCLSPTFPPEYYIEQSLIYFDTLDSSVSPFIQPNYSELVARWEWPPWLLLTGYTDESLIITDTVLKLFPTAFSRKECQFFETQPFGRCHVVFDYEGFPCPIYEEFTFNDQGEMTFIEAWSDFPGWLPEADPDDYWFEGEDVRRLATRVPGLGNATGKIDLDADWMIAAAEEDPELAEFVRRARDPWTTWFDEVFRNFGVDLEEVGCNPPENHDAPA